MEKEKTMELDSIEKWMGEHGFERDCESKYNFCKNVDDLLRIRLSFHEGFYNKNDFDFFAYLVIDADDKNRYPNGYYAYAGNGKTPEEAIMRLEGAVRKYVFSDILPVIPCNTCEQCMSNLLDSVGAR